MFSDVIKKMKKLYEKYNIIFYMIGSIAVKT